jgi:hypothetical protein
MHIGMYGEGINVCEGCLIETLKGLPHKDGWSVHLYGAGDSYRGGYNLPGWREKLEKMGLSR